MPRFKETETEIIRGKLLSEGEKLFTMQGLKKVTIDELAKAVHIAKATFYTFYKSKEYLYLDIVQDIQKDIFLAMSNLLVENASAPNKQRVKQVFQSMSVHMKQYPILMQIDTSTIEIISRKVDKERMFAFYKQNIDAAQTMWENGVRFSCDVKVASVIFQTLYRSYLNMPDSNQNEQLQAMELMLDGIIDKIVLG